MKTRTWITRFLILVVCAVNVYCAIVFILFPENYLEAYELSGVGGLAAIRGLGVAFLMWNATYPFLMVHPDRYRVLYVIVLMQQAIGIIGESLILLSLPAGHEVLAQNIMRFITFDSLGLVLLIAGFFLSRTSQKDRLPKHFSG